MILRPARDPNRRRRPLDGLQNGYLVATVWEASSIKAAVHDADENQQEAHDGRQYFNPAFEVEDLGLKSGLRRTKH